MFISTFDLFKIGIGPSSSHTIGPMKSAKFFVTRIDEFLSSRQNHFSGLRLKIYLKGALAATGKGHGTNWALALGLKGMEPDFASRVASDKEIEQIRADALDMDSFISPAGHIIQYHQDRDLRFHPNDRLDEHPNAMVFQLLDKDGFVLLSETYFSIGGGFVCAKSDEDKSVSLIENHEQSPKVPYPFSAANELLQLADLHALSFSEIMLANEQASANKSESDKKLDDIVQAMLKSVESGLSNSGELSGGLRLKRRARQLHHRIISQTHPETHDLLCAYAMAVNEENAAGHMVVTAPTNGAAGVIPSVLYYLTHHEGLTREKAHSFLLTAAAIGGIIKQCSSISGAELGCQGEVGSASAMAAAALCAVKGGSNAQIENAAEIALEHHLGMTCDPVNGLVQVPCIERNGFGAVKAYTAASLALLGDGSHFISLDKCIAAMKEIGEEMSIKFKETALGGLAVNWVDC